MVLEFLIYHILIFSNLFLTNKISNYLYLLFRLLKTFRNHQQVFYVQNLILRIILEGPLDIFTLIYKISLLINYEVLELIEVPYSIHAHSTIIPSFSLISIQTKRDSYCNVWTFASQSVGFLLKLINLCVD